MPESTDCPVNRAGRESPVDGKAGGRIFRRRPCPAVEDGFVPINTAAVRNIRPGGAPFVEYSA